MKSMVKKLNEYEITSRDGPFINADCNAKIINTLVRKINELVDAVNSVVSVQEKLIDSRFVAETKHEVPAENLRPDYVTTSYMTNGRTEEYYGQKGASIVTDPPLPAGYVITIREPETKGGDNE